MRRTLTPELLDALPPDHPDALHNRRDLRVTNFVLGNHRWFARTLPPLLSSGERILEVGAGTGELSLRLAARGISIDGLDLWPSPPAWPAGSDWHRTDVRDFDRFAAYGAVIGNLIFHQFSDADLQRLGERMRRHVRVIVAAEPARRRVSRWLYRTIAPVFGANHVSLHDGDVSIAAGFRGDELPGLFGLTSDHWDVRCGATLAGIYRMIAIRRA